MEHNDIIGLLKTLIMIRFGGKMMMTFWVKIITLRSNTSQKADDIKPMKVHNVPKKKDERDR